MPVTRKPLVVHITVKSATEVAGTFEGAFFNMNIGISEMLPDHILITEGEFKPSIQ